MLHARTSIERRNPWLAEYWISEARNKMLALACIRLGYNGVHGRGYAQLPDAVTAPFAATLVRSLDEAELRRALGAATGCFLAELRLWDEELHTRLMPILQEFGTS